jgi:hypothetical protein
VLSGRRSGAMMLDQLAVRVAMLKRIEQFLAENRDKVFESEPDLWAAFIQWVRGGG